MGDNCPDVLKTRKSGINVCTSEVCFDANFSCLNIPLGANLSQALQIMESAICWNGTLPSCVSVSPGATLQDVIEALALKVCLEESLYESKTAQDLGSDPAWSSSVWFVPTNGDYSTLIHTNTSLTETKTYMVGATVAYGQSNTGGLYGDSDVDMAIFHRDTSPTDTLESELIGAVQIDFTYTPNPVDLDNNVYNINTSNSDMAEVTLLPGESVLLKFRTKNASDGWIRQAKLHVRQKH